MNSKYLLSVIEQTQAVQEEDIQLEFQVRAKCHKQIEKDTQEKGKHSCVWLLSIMECLWGWVSELEKFHNSNNVHEKKANNYL